MITDIYTAPPATVIAATAGFDCEPAIRPPTDHATTYRSDGSFDVVLFPTEGRVNPNANVAQPYPGGRWGKVL